MKIAHRIIDGSYANAIYLKCVSTRRITNLSCMSAASVHQLSRSTAAEILVQRALVRSDTTFPNGIAAARQLQTQTIDQRRCLFFSVRIETLKSLFSVVSPRY